MLGKGRGGRGRVPIARFKRLQTPQKMTDHHQNNRYSGGFENWCMSIKCAPQLNASTVVGKTVIKTLSTETGVENNSAARQPIQLNHLSVHTASGVCAMRIRIGSH